MRILHVNALLEPNLGGGAAERTFQMSRFMAEAGLTTTVLTMSTGVTAERISALTPARVVTIDPMWGRFQVPRLKLKLIRDLVSSVDIVHLMAHWSVLNAIVYRAAVHLGKPYVVCPVGTLPVFGRSSFLKSAYNTLVGYRMIRGASAWIAVTAGEFPQFEAYGVPSGDITVIPNGVSERDFPAGDGRPLLRSHGVPDDATVLLFMGRLNAIKGPDLLLEAFIRIAAEHPACHLVFAGPDSGMLADLRRIVGERGMDGRVHFLGYVTGADKSAVYRAASLLVVPSRQEAMSIVALEAGLCGTPVLLTDQCGFGDVRAVDDRLEVPATAEGLAGGLRSLLAESGDLIALGSRFKGFVLRDFAWESIGRRYIDLYRDVIARHEATAATEVRTR